MVRLPPFSVTVPPTIVLAAPTDRVPPVTVRAVVVAPELLVLDRVSVPVPLLVRVLVPPLMAPLIVVSASVLTVAEPVRVTALVRVAALVTFRVDPLPRVVVPLPRLPALLIDTVVLESSVVPPLWLLAPDRTKALLAEAFCNVRVCAPEIVPERVATAFAAKLV